MTSVLTVAGFLVCCIPFVAAAVLIRGPRERRMTDDQRADIAYVKATGGRLTRRGL